MAKKSKKKFIYGTWTSLNIINNGPNARLDVELVLSDRQESLMISCRFSGVSGLEVGNLNFHKNLSLEIKDITGDWLTG